MEAVKINDVDVFSGGGEAEDWVRIAEIMDPQNLGISFRRAPYNSPGFEYSTEPDEGRRRRLVSRLEEDPEMGKRLWRKSRILAEISRLAASHKALERVYLGPDQDREDGLSLAWGHFALTFLHNAKGARNRLSIVEDELIKSLEGNTEPNVLSIAAGSGRGMLQALARLGGETRKRACMIMVDSSRRAGKDGMALASSLGIASRVTCLEHDVIKTSKCLPRGVSCSEFDFAEMVGLWDYLADEQIVILLKNLRSNMADGGTILGSNIADNDERGLLHTVIGWPKMRYRTAEELEAVCRQAGFTSVRHIKEPLGIYNLVALKS